VRQFWLNDTKLQGSTRSTGVRTYPMNVMIGNGNDRTSSLQPDSSYHLKEWF